jgi:DNA replication protein DnaC
MSSYRRPRIDRLTDTHLQRLNIGKRYWGAELPSYQDVSEAYIQVCHKFTSRFDDFHSRGVGLYLWGNNSRGKTYAATAILQDVTRQGYSAYCVMADQLRSIYIEPQMFDPDMSVVQRVETAEVLLIEDLGKEYTGKGSGWAELCFENLLRKRTREMRSTIITTNLSPKDFKDRYKESAQAICLENMLSVQVKGQDHRRRIQSEIQEMLSNA